MRIISCHIDNFGKLSDFNYNFEFDELNVVKEDNSWGKTTFSVFLKAMFYGLEYNSKKTNERKQYEPWQGGVFGGNLAIEIEGKEYRIERTFGKKEKDDTFRIVDLNTGKESLDYSENIGEEIFKIDRESFSKSIFIPQCQMQTNMTDSFNAKIGNLTQVKDDISNFEVVKSKLEDKKKEFGSRGKKSKIVLLKEELSLLKEKELERNNIEESAVLIEAHLKEKKDELERLYKDKQKLSEAMDVRSKNAHNEALYKNAVNNLQQSKDKIGEIQNKYSGKIIDGDDVNNLKNEFESIKSLRQQLTVLKLDDDSRREYLEYNKLLEKGIPSDEFFSELRMIFERIKVLQVSLLNSKLPDEEIKRVQELKDFFRECYPSEEEINLHISNYHKAEMYKKDILSAEIEINSMNDDFKVEEKKISIPFVVAGIIFVLLGVGLGILIHPVLFAVLVVGVIGIIYGCTATKNTKSNSVGNSQQRERKNAEIAVMKQQCEELEKSYKEFLQCFRVRYSENVVEVLMEIRDNHSELERLNNEMIKKNESFHSINKDIDEFMGKAKIMLSPYMDEAELTVSEDIIIHYEKIYDYLKKAVGVYGQLKDRQQRYDDVDKRLQNHLKVYTDIEKEYSTSGTVDPYELEADYKEYLREINNCKNLSAEIEEIAKSLPDKDEEYMDYDECRRRLSECESIITVVQEDINRHSRDIENKYNELEETDDIDNEIIQINNQIEECKIKYQIIEDTLQYLQMAKESFSARYLGPVRTAFSKYLKLVNGMEVSNINPEDLEIDIDLNATLNYGSIGKSKDSLSRGYQDLVELCIRFALIDVMYMEERPVIILDDPFVNLDEHKIGNALSMLREISKEYQIIYFTCHTSRV